MNRDSWLWNHIGRISGMVLFLAAFIATAFLAVIGFRPAIVLLLVLIAGVAMIAIGWRMHRA